MQQIPARCITSEIESPYLHLKAMRDKPDKEEEVGRLADSEVFFFSLPLSVKSD